MRASVFKQRKEALFRGLSWSCHLPVKDMDVHARKKALFRAKLKEHEERRDKRIDSPIVKYNEFDQPVCKVCEIVLKSELFWKAHQVSRKHHEAIESIKASAASQAKSENIKLHKLHVLLPERKSECSSELQNVKPKISEPLQKMWPSSVLPANFFDEPKPKRAGMGKSISGLSGDERQSSLEEQTNGFSCVDTSESAVHICETVAVMQTSNQDISQEKRERNMHVMEAFTDSDENAVRLPVGNTEVQGDVKTDCSTDIQTSKKNGNSESKGPLPEGFFDNKDADLRARGIEHVKPDIKEEYKEFENVIQVDLQDVDNRMEAEEFDAAEMIEEAEVVEQRAYRGKVEILKRKKMELESARSAKLTRAPEIKNCELTTAESSSDEEEYHFIFNWRAKHL